MHQPANSVSVGSGLKPEVTTVIPTFRRPRLLRRAINSALEQDGVEARVSVFDNCSGDDTGSVVAGLQDSRVGYYCHPFNLGALKNFQYGVARVDTPFFSILSDDDYLLPGFYQRAIAALEAHPEAMFWIGVTLNVDGRGTVWDARMNRWEREGLFLPPEGAIAMTGGLAPTWTGMVFRREVLDQAGFIDPETLGPSDLDYTLRLGVRFPYLFEKVPVAVFTINSQSFSATQPLASFWPGWLKMFRNLERMPGVEMADRNRLLAALHADAKRMLYRRGVNALANGRVDFARDAAAVLDAYYQQNVEPGILRSLAFGCERVPGVQPLLSMLYRALERRILHGRRQLQHDYGHLLREA